MLSANLRLQHYPETEAAIKLMYIEVAVATC